MSLNTRTAALITAVAFVALGLYLWDHSPPMKFIEGHITPQVAAPGQPIDVSITLDWVRLCELNVTRVMRDGAGEEHKLPWSPSSPPPKIGLLTSTRSIIVPTAAKFGKNACYRATIYMQCGIIDKIFPIRIEVPCEAMPFEIIPPSK